MSKQIKKIVQKGDKYYKEISPVDKYISKEGLNMGDMLISVGDWKPDEPVQQGPIVKAKAQAPEANAMRRRRTRGGSTVLNPQDNYLG